MGFRVSGSGLPHLLPIRGGVRIPPLNLHFGLVREREGERERARAKGRERGRESERGREREREGETWSASRPSSPEWRSPKARKCCSADSSPSCFRVWGSGAVAPIRASVVRVGAVLLRFLLLM